MAVEVEEREETELTRIYQWRFDVLREGGFSVLQARTLAISEADLHRAVEMRKVGCDPALVVSILT